MTEMLPSCPFCKGTDIASVPADDAPDYDTDYNVVAQCMTCGARGPDGEFRSGADAFAAWSRRAPVTVSEAAGVQDAESIPDYDAGLLNDFGGGNVDWWLDYVRAEIGRANDHWRDALRALAGRNE